MKIWTALLAVAMALITSQALAENWVKIGTTAGKTITVDTDDFRKGIDGLVYYDLGLGDQEIGMAVDCRRRVIYVDPSGEAPDWRNKGTTIAPKSAAEAEMTIVCAKAGSDPLPGNWVGIGFGQSIDKDSIRRGSDGLVYFTDYGDTFHLTGPESADCQQRLIYFGVNFDGWREHGLEVAPGSFAEAELNYVCANVR